MAKERDESPEQREARLRAEESERVKEWAQLDREQKNAQAVEAAFGSPEDLELPRWAVSIPGDGAQPRLVLPARDEDQAVTRYNRLCGIRQTDHKHQVEAA